MGKDNGKGEKKASEKKVGRSAKDEGFKFGAVDLAERMGITDVALRVKLRNSGLQKAGSVWGWNSVAELKEVQEKLESSGRKSSKKDAGEKKTKAEAKDNRPAEKKAAAGKKGGTPPGKSQSKKAPRREDANEGEGAAA